MSQEAHRDVIEQLDFRAFLDEAPFGVLTIDETSTILYANDAVERIFGHTPAELVGEPLDVVVPERLRERHYDSFEAYRETGERHINWDYVELSGLHADGHEVPLALTFREYTIDGIPVYTGIIRDITEQKRRERELARSNEDLERFAYVVSHDMKEPLRMVSSYLQLLERRYEDQLDDDAEEFIEYAVDGANRMRLMIDDLLKYSRVGRADIDRERVDCNDVLQTVRTNLRVSIEETGAAVEVDDLPTVGADRGQLVQLFQNLVNNALKYAGDGPRIEITATNEGDEWVFSVADDGPGIPPEQADTVFELFAGSDEAESTGMGLAICRRIVERHGGEIWVESEPDEGATFSFALPTVDDTANA